MLGSMICLEFTYYLLLLLLVLICPFIYFRLKLMKKNALQLSTLQYNHPPIRSRVAYYTPLIFEVFIIGLIIITLAGPHRTYTREKIGQSGVDIAFVLDVSLSMQAADFKPTRLEALKSITDNFIRHLHSDRIALFIFAAHSFTQLPLTSDLIIARELIQGIAYNSVDHYTGGGTAIGDALLLATETLVINKIPGRDQAIVLISDGESNIGISPLLAVKYPVDKGIKFYAIGIGSDETVKVLLNGEPVYTINNEQMTTTFSGAELEKLAELAGGIYYRADTTTVLQEIFDHIETLEKSPLKTSIQENVQSYRPSFSIVIFILYFLYLCIGMLLRRPFR